jgi:thiol:disulfide interchange protein
VNDPSPEGNRNPGTTAPPAVPPRRNALVWLAVGAFVVWMQWPMLKGAFYRATGAAAPAAIDWRTDLDAALAEARSTGRLVLADFSADWCPPCVVMKHDVWPDDEIGALVARSYVPVLVDPDRDEKAAARYGIDAIPAVLILDGSGRVVARAGYLPASGMRRFLRERR